jgi:hypothetical protein
VILFWGVKSGNDADGDQVKDASSFSSYAPATASEARPGPGPPTPSSRRDAGPSGHASRVCMRQAPIADQPMTQPAMTAVTAQVGMGGIKSAG